ncbi:bifunctional 5,10-methylenetetrahydrofolate dehydrogenase/5,10-methenyltetrahydrofolate cyclohydrolase [Patescibacteria group bacterium]|nr:bifunctional 5,10-methylenetetrahydrofolate dehydrogenase/5,10-methenyltetrahydrofolate cyclohydrolase [Patescibacteria group bacterium]
MENKIINGKLLSQKIIRSIRDEVKKENNKIGLAVILIGDDPSSHLYVKIKKQACEDCGIDFHQYFFNRTNSTEEVVSVIEFLNADPETNGILVQLPLPKEFDTEKIISAIDPAKDVDGFHPKTLENIQKCDLSVVSPLILGIVELIKSTEEEIKNKKITILCNHKIFGTPFHCFFDETNEINIVTLKEENYPEKVSEADILIVSIGRMQFITSEMIKQDAIIIDVGINKIGDDVCGDVDFEDVLPKVKFITPVPGGVGPMTVAMLLKNLLKLSH